MASFHKGFVYERNVSSALTIEGRPIKLIPPKDRRFAAQLPCDDTVEQIRGAISWAATL
jgi:hypothetical protein